MGELATANMTGYSHGFKEKPGFMTDNWAWYAIVDYARMMCRVLGKGAMMALVRDTEVCDDAKLEAALNAMYDIQAEASDAWPDEYPAAFEAIDPNYKDLSNIDVAFDTSFGFSER